MKHKFFNIGLIILIILSAVSPIFAANHTTEITIHKLKYDTDLTNDKLIKNDGTEKTPDASIVPYDAETYGAVGFTLYKLNNDKLVEALKANGGNGQAAADSIANDIAGNTASGLIEKVEVAEVTQTDTTPKTMTVATQNNGYYLLVESTSPTKTVVAKSQPMLLELPMKNIEGTGLLTEVHLYPKNKVDDTKRIAKFEKILIKDLSAYYTGDAAGSEGLSGAKFEVLYSKTKPTDETDATQYQNLMKEGNKVIITSGPDGKFELSDLKEGYYALKEINTDKIQINGEAKVEGAKIFGANRLIPFSYSGQSGVISGVSTPRVIDNYSTTKIEKTIKNNKVEYGQTLEYTVKLKNLHFEAFNSKGDVKLVLEDTVTPGAKILTNTLELRNPSDDTPQWSKVDASKIAQNTDNHMKVELSATDLGYSEDKKDPYRFSGGVELEFKYQVLITKDYDYNTNKTVTNQVTQKFIDGNFEFEPPQPNTPGTPNNPTNKVESQVFDQVFKKQDSGLWNTGAVKQALAGAEFIISKVDETGKTVYRAEDTATKYKWVEDKAQAFHYVTGQDGKFMVEGISSKDENDALITYTATEVKAPENYVLPQLEADREHTFTVGTDTKDTNEDTQNVITINNHRAVDAPMTGYEKSTITLAALIVLGVVAFFLTKKRKQVISK